MPKLIGIPLQVHCLEPQIFKRRFSTYGGGQFCNRFESGTASRLPGEGGDHVHCTDLLGVDGHGTKVTDIWGGPENLRGSLGSFRGSLGNFRATSGLPLKSTVREVPGKSPRNSWKSSGNFCKVQIETFQKLGGVRLPPSDTPKLSPNKEFRIFWCCMSSGCLAGEDFLQVFVG